MDSFVTNHLFWGPLDPSWRIIPGLGYVVNNHGDGFRPLRIRLFPFQIWPNFMAYKMGVALTTYPSPGRILQVGLDPQKKNTGKKRVLLIGHPTQHNLHNLSLTICRPNGPWRKSRLNGLVFPTKHVIPKSLPSGKLTVRPWKSPSFLVNTIKMVDVPWLC